LLLIVEGSFFSANVAKVAHGAWLPLVVGVLISVVMMTWRRGRTILHRNRTHEQGSLDEFLAELAATKPPLPRVEGTAIFVSSGKGITPLALRAEVEHNHLLHEKLVIVSVNAVSLPRVPESDRFRVRVVGRGLYKAVHLTLGVGYREAFNLPARLVAARKRGLLERGLDLEHATYFVSRVFIKESGDASMARWRQRLFIAMARNATSPNELFALPNAQTVTMGSQIPL
jgi:KUP system potassium uptake protein